MILNISHYNQKHSIKDLFLALFKKLKLATPYNNFIYKNINGSILHYFHTKLVKLNFFKTYFDYYIHKYTIEMFSYITDLYVDSTMIANKYGIDLADYNIQLKKHKTSKISIVVDSFNFPIDINFNSSREHDSTICIEHLDNIARNLPHLCKSNINLVADAAYDSNRIRNKLKETNIGILVCDKNNRNTKDHIKLENNKKINLHHKMLLKNRSKIEHLNNTIKQNKTINVRYDKIGANYMGYVLMAISKIAFGKAGVI